jgi:7-carboxy-7-deazaguanine synthase
LSTLTLTEIYTSIQGESTHAGRPCVFVRLSGCPLRCKWCDTVYSFKEGEIWSFEKLRNWLSDSGVKLVEFTGGEPLAQIECKNFINKLVDDGYEVLIETSGSEPIGGLHPDVAVIMDIKCPDSGMSDRNLYENIPLLNNKDEIKFVVASRKDFDWAVNLIRERKLEDGPATLLFSVAFGLVKEEQLVDWLLESKVNARLNVQIHKYIWSPRKKGV